MIADIFYTPDDDRPSIGMAQSDFMALFASIVSLFGTRTWWIESGGYVCWNLTEDELLSDHEIDFGSFADGILVTGEHFVQNAYRLTDFNLDIAVANSGVDLINQRVRQFEIGTGYPISLPDDCCIAFSNLDAAYWSIIHQPDDGLDQLLPKWRHHRRSDASQIG